MASRNFTISLPEELIRKARILAARRDISVSALVGSLLNDVVDHDDDYSTAWERELELMSSGAIRVGPITWTRDGLHER